MSEHADMVKNLAIDIAQKLLDHAQNADSDLAPEELLGQMIMPVLANILRLAGDIILADGKPSTQCRIQVKVNDKHIEAAHSWTEPVGEAAVLEPEQISVNEAVYMLRDSIEGAVHQCLDRLPSSYHRLGLALTSLEQVMAKLLLSSGDVTVRDKLNAVTELSSSLQRALLIDGHPNLMPRTRH